MGEQDEELTQDDYHHRLTNALMTAIFETTLVEIDGQQRAMIHTPQVCEALCVVLATMIEPSYAASTNLPLF